MSWLAQLLSPRESLRYLRISEDDRLEYIILREDCKSELTVRGYLFHSKLLVGLALSVVPNVATPHSCLLLSDISSVTFSCSQYFHIERQILKNQ